MRSSVTVACIQAEPVILDRDATIEKLAGLAAEAAGSGAKLAVFPEAFIPAYPSSVWAGALAGWAEPGAKEAFAMLARESLELPGESRAARLGAGRRRGPARDRNRPRSSGRADLLGELHAARPLRALRVGGGDLHRLDRRRRRQLAVDADSHRPRGARLRRQPESLPARSLLPRGLPACEAARRRRARRPRRQRDPRSGRVVRCLSALRRGGDPLRRARPGAARRRAAAVRP